MIVIADYKEYAKVKKIPHTQGTVVCIGNFDGLHSGHHKLLSLASEKAKVMGCDFLVLSFSPHPIQVLYPQKEYVSLYSRQYLVQNLGKYNVSILCLQSFDETISQMTPLDFIHKILVASFHIKHLYVGENFAFGFQRQGNIQLLKQELQNINCEIEPLPIVQDSIGNVVSTTLIKKLLIQGEIQRVTECLEREYSIFGKVIHGQKLGRNLNFPTLNVYTDSLKLFRMGVYLSRVKMNGKTFNSITNIGVRPTLQNKDLQLISETHIFNETHDFYDQDVEIEFLDFIRDEKKFSSLEHLKEQIKTDVEIAQLAHMTYSRKYDILRVK